MMRRITLFVAALAAYTLLGMAFVSAAKLNDKAAKLTDEPIGRGRWRRHTISAPAMFLMTLAMDMATS